MRKNPNAVLDVWMASTAGLAAGACYKKWADIAYAINPSSNKALNALTATIDAMYAADTLSAGQKTEWDAEKADMVAAVPDIKSAVQGVLP